MVYVILLNFTDKLGFNQNASFRNNLRAERSRDKMFNDLIFVEFLDTRFNLGAGTRKVSDQERKQSISVQELAV